MNGFKNEDSIINYINTTSFEMMEIIHQKLILSLNNSLQPETISARKYGGQNKADIGITIDGDEFFFSIKKGTGNSVHQEPIEEFIAFLREVEVNESVFDDLRFFIWGDGTLNGTGSKLNRINSSQLHREYPVKIQNIQRYFNKYIDSLIDRFVITGVKSNKGADYLWYGDKKDGITISKENMRKVIKSLSKKTLSIGALTFQAWNRALNDNPKLEERRGVIQLKWGTLEQDILNFYNE